MNQFTRRRTIKSSFIMAFFILIPSTVINAQSLEQTLQLALENNPQIKAQEYSVSKAALEAKAVVRETLPTLSFDAAYNHVTDVPKIELPAMGLFSGLTVFSFLVIKMIITQIKAK